MGKKSTYSKSSQVEPGEPEEVEEGEVYLHPDTLAEYGRSVEHRWKTKEEIAEQEEKEEGERDQWGSRIVFILSAIGSAIGTGNVWRFPYLAYTYGGGAFLVPYFLSLFILGIPLLVMEFGLGQYNQIGTVAVFKSMHWRLRGVGWAIVVPTFLITCYYNIIMSWSTIYLVNSFSLELPWTTNASCIALHNTSYYVPPSANDTSNMTIGGPECFLDLTIQNVPGFAGIGDFVWQTTLGYLLIWVIVYFCVWKGVHSAGKVVLITVPLPILLLFILLVRGVTLDGASTGLAYLFRVDFSQLGSVEVWTAAASQIFFSIGVGMGIMPTYASYNSRKLDCVRNAVIISLSNSFFSIIAGCTVFSIIGFMAKERGVGIDEAVAQGPALAFIAFPRALSMMPAPFIFSILFFLMLLNLGIDSSFSFIEAVNGAISDVMPKAKTWKVALVVCVAGFTLGLVFCTRAGYAMLSFSDHFLSNTLLVGGLVEVIAVGFFYGVKRLRNEIDEMATAGEEERKVVRRKSLYHIASLHEMKTGVKPHPRINKAILAGREEHDFEAVDMNDEKTNKMKTSKSRMTFHYVLMRYHDFETRVLRHIRRSIWWVIEWRIILPLLILALIVGQLYAEIVTPFKIAGLSQTPAWVVPVGWVIMVGIGAVIIIGGMIPFGRSLPAQVEKEREERKEKSGAKAAVELEEMKKRGEERKKREEERRAGVDEHDGSDVEK